MFLAKRKALKKCFLDARKDFRKSVLGETKMFWEEGNILEKIIQGDSKYLLKNQIARKNCKQIF